jgi:hypothetical protein
MRNKITAMFFIFSILLFWSAVFCQAAETEKQSTPCEGLETAIIVDTDYHKMWMCHENKIIKEFRVSIGKGGVDKRKQGDKKTPLGEYTLGTPRHSDKFGIFIPIGYPTWEQILNGFSGSDDGIHGPHPLFKWLGQIITWIDWTEGCIAVGTDDDIYEIAQWVIEQNVSRIVIR